MRADPQPRLSEIIVYPVKSIGGLTLSSAWVEKQGLVFDRRFMLAQQDGAMITARQFPQLFHVSAVLTPGGLSLSYPGHDGLALSQAAFTMREVQTNVFKDRFIAWSTTEEANRWFSTILNQPVQLLFTGEQSNRTREAIPFNISFADGYPLLIVSETSLAALNERSDSLISMDRFRPNLIVSGTG
ncbi:MOSC domain-containing protein [Enterobacter adelaidei]